MAESRYPEVLDPRASPCLELLQLFASAIHRTAAHRLFVLTRRSSESTDFDSSCGQPEEQFTMTLARASCRFLRDSLVSLRDLFAAGIAVVPEASPDTSVSRRVEQVKAQGRASDLKAAEQGSVAGSNSAAGLEESIWLCPIEDRHKLDSSREGMLGGFSLGNYYTEPVSRCMS